MCVCACVVCVHLGVSTRLCGRSYVYVWVSVCVCGCVRVCLPMSVSVHMSTYVGVCECHVSGCTCKCVSVNVWVCVGVCDGGRGESVTVMGYSEWSESWVSCRGQFIALISANTSLPDAGHSPALGSRADSRKGLCCPGQELSPGTDPLWHHLPISEGWWSVKDQSPSPVRFIT